MYAAATRTFTTSIKRERARGPSASFKRPTTGGLHRPTPRPPVPPRQQGPSTQVTAGRLWRSWSGSIPTVLAEPR
ncbi:MAG: CRISPR-associated protein Cas5 [Deltaproteobacteria bacterium]|nr:CRISPR-associated protein Cas5 [Deltaproteobacteria bacterium]